MESRRRHTVAKWETKKSEAAFSSTACWKMAVKWEIVGSRTMPMPLAAAEPSGCRRINSSSGKFPIHLKSWKQSLLKLDNAQSLKKGSRDSQDPVTFNLSTAVLDRQLDSWLRKVDTLLSKAHKLRKLKGV